MACAQGPALGEARGYVERIGRQARVGVKGISSLCKWVVWVCGVVRLELVVGFTGK